MTTADESAAAAAALPPFLKAALRSALPFLKSALLTLAPDLLARAAVKELQGWGPAERAALKATLQGIADGLE